MSTSFAPQIGERFAGRYELKSPLRSDGAVRAFLAFDHHAGLDVALLLLDPACAHPNAWAEFARIVAAATAGKIAGLVLPQGVAGTPPVPPFCLAEPQALRGFDKLRDQGPMPWQRALTLGERAAEILHAAHAATGVAHRVLTPSRCAVTVRDDVRVLDFGVAELELGRPDEAGYRAPEQQQGGGDTRSDAYTLAVILFELISSQKSAGKTPPRLRSLVAVPRPVDEFMAKALSRDPAQRPDLAAMRAGLRELLGVAEAPVEATPAAAPRPDPKPEIPPASIISAPPGASAPLPAKPGAVVAAGPALANVAMPPMRPSAPSSAASAAPLMPIPEVNPPRPPPMVAPRGEILGPSSPPAPAVTFKTEILGPSSPPAPAATFKTEILGPSSPPAPAVTFKTEILPPSSPPAPAVTFKTEILGPSSPPAPAATFKTEILGPSSPPVGAVTDRTEIFFPSSPTPAPAVTDRTEIFFPGSPTPAPAVTDRTEIFFPGSSTPAPAVTDRTEILPPVHRPTSVDPGRTEIVRADGATASEASTAPRNPLRGPLALARTKASAAVLVTSPPAEAIVKPPSPADSTLLLPPEPAHPVPTVEPRPFDPQSRPTVEVRPLAADPDEATAGVAPARSSTSSKPAEDPFKKSLIWINVLCVAGLVLVALWLLIR